MIDCIEKLAFERCGKHYRPIAYYERARDSAQNQFGDYVHNILFATEDGAEFEFRCYGLDGTIAFVSGSMGAIR